jgi:pimeloyl-ACP methyl ester carboxylesterase
MRGEFIDVGDRRLYYYAAGSRGAGNPILLLHGFPTSGHLWSEVVHLLPKGHRVVVLDLLGYGRSDGPGTADLSLHAHAGRVVGFMDALRITQAIVVGHHLGGGVAQALATQWPDRCSHLGLLHSIGFDVTLTGTLALLRAFRPLSGLLPGAALFRIVHRELERWYADPGRGRHSVDQYLRAFLQPGGHRAFLRHVGAFREAEGATLAAALGAIRIPVAILAGRADRVVPSSVAIRLQKTVSGATLDFIEDGRHFSPEEAPERVADVIADLIAR